MPSVDSKELVDQIIAAKGRYMDDPSVIQVSQYTNNWGGTTYHLAYNENEVLNLYASPFCKDIKVLWTLEPDPTTQQLYDGKLK